MIINANDRIYSLYAKKFIKIKSVDFIQMAGATEALKCLKDSSEKIDLIITDFSTMNGYEFAKELKKEENTKHIPIIAITNFPEQNYSQEVFAKVICITNVEKTLNDHVIETLNINN